MQELAPYHFGHLPVWVDGNAYFNGATVSKHDKNHRVCAEKAQVSLCEKDGKWLLDTNVYDLLNDFRTGIITSDLLGKAFEPEQRFENPDGTEIIFDRDYFGDHRGTEALPGPFACSEELKRSLW